MRVCEADETFASPPSSGERQMAHDGQHHVHVILSSSQRVRFPPQAARTGGRMRQLAKREGGSLAYGVHGWTRVQRQHPKELQTTKTPWTLNPKAHPWLGICVMPRTDILPQIEDL
jgi:hypothetical protein